MVYSSINNSDGIGNILTFPQITARRQCTDYTVVEILNMFTIFGRIKFIDTFLISRVFSLDNAEIIISKVMSKYCLQVVIE